MSGNYVDNPLKIDRRPLWRILTDRTRPYQILFVLFVVLVVLFALDPPEGLSTKGYRAMLLFFGCTVLWVSGIIPLAVTSLLAMAAMTALIGVVAGYLGRQPRIGVPGAGPTLASLAAAVLALAGLVWLAAPQPTLASPSTGVRDAPIRVALYNVQMGFGVAGRFAVDDQAEVLAAWEPDVVVLNEADRGWL